jgi:adenylosuccinate synthase
VIGVVKAYTTRVGSGPLPTELPSPMQERVRELGGEYGATTGRPRRCGWFDAVVVRYAARVNGLTGLAVTKLDVLDTLDEIRIATGYRAGGETARRVPRRPRPARRGRARLRDDAGLAELDAEARRWEDLPRPRAPTSAASRS